MEIRAAYDLPRNGRLKRPGNKLAVLDIVLNPERGGNVANYQRKCELNLKNFLKATPSKILFVSNMDGSIDFLIK